MTVKASDRSGQGLQEDAIDLALRKSMEDLKKLLRWASETEDPEEALKHIRRSKELIAEMEANLERVADE
jgi:hypothetical protein